MATEPVKKESAANVQPIKPKKKGKLLWIIIAVVVVAGGGGAAWFFLKPAAAPAAKAAAEAARPKATAQYYKFDPPFVVNFGGEANARYLQVTAQAMSRDPAILDLLKNNEPAVRNDLVILYSSQEAASLMTVDGKEKLRQATLDVIRKILDAEGGNGKLIEAVYFTSFVIQ